MTEDLESNVRRFMAALGYSENAAEIAVAIAAARLGAAHEREACAHIADSLVFPGISSSRVIAEEIRARVTK